MKISFYNIGCKVNFADVNSIAKEFELRGYQIVPFDEPADVVLINTCTVTKNADADCRKYIRRAARLSPDAFIAVLGCYVQVNPGEVSAIEGVDAVFGTNDKFSIFEHLDSFEKRKFPEKFVSTSAADFHGSSSQDNESHTRIVLKIQDGCDYVCSYCIVPHARGKSRSMDFGQLKERIGNLESTDYYEAVLSGINLGEYKAPTGETLFDVLKFITESKTKLRFRLSSIEPNLLSDDIINLVSSSDKICPSFHIPLQSGSQKILGLMKRRYNTETFENLIYKIKDKIPHCGIGADIITGFPGESDEEHDVTYSLLEKLPVSYLHVFTYSERKGTAAENYENAVPYQVRKQRTIHLRELSDLKKKQFYQSQIGKTMTTIPENYDLKTGLWTGWTENYIKINFAGPSTLQSIPQIVKLKELKNGFVLAMLKN